MYIWQDEAYEERQRLIGRSVPGKREGGKVSKVWIAIAVILGFHVLFLLAGLLYEWWRGW